MRNRRSRSFGKLLIPPLALTLLLGACKEDSPTGLVESFTAGIQLVNGDEGNATHLFLPGENFPCCQVPPGGGRTTPMPVIQGQGYTFRAGRNGAELDTATCFVRRDAKASNSFGVRFSPGFTVGGVFAEGPELRCSGTGWEDRR